MGGIPVFYNGPNYPPGFKLYFFHLSNPHILYYRAVDTFAVAGESTKYLTHLKNWTLRHLSPFSNYKCTERPFSVSLFLEVDTNRLEAAYHTMGDKKNIQRRSVFRMYMSRLTTLSLSVYGFRILVRISTGPAKLFPGRNHLGATTLTSSVLTWYSSLMVGDRKRQEVGNGAGTILYLRRVLNA